MAIPVTSTLIEPFYVMELLARAQTLAGEGKDIIHMEIGEPDFPTPPAILAAAQAYIAAGDVKYSPAAGLPALRRAIADYYQHRYGVAIAPQRVFVTPGASGALWLALASTLRPGNAVLMSDPGYPCYRHLVSVFGGNPVGIAVDGDTDFQLNAALLKRHWQAHTAGAIVASPANPTGTRIGAQALAELLEFVNARDGFVIADEIYQGLEYAETAASTALAWTDAVFVVNSFSKFFGMTGWRLGWLIVPTSHISIVERLAQNLFIAAPTPSQAAALAAFTEDNLLELERRRLEFQRRRDFLLQALPALGFSLPAKPDGAFYIYADASRFTRDSFEFAWRLLENAHVAVTPGKDFGHHQAERHIRFSYTASLPALIEGIARIERFIGRCP